MDKPMAKFKPLPKRDWVLQRIRYEPESGLFWWRKSGGWCSVDRPAGKRAYREKDGKPAAIDIMIESKIYKAHRLAWLIMTGNDPGNLSIDHINRNPFDNRWINLRLADDSVQMLNRFGYGKSSYKGVSFRSDSLKWIAQVWINGRKKYLGQFLTEEEAAAAAAPYFAD